MGFVPSVPELLFFGRRVQKVFTKNGVTTTTNYFYDGANILETEDQNGALVARYADTLSVDEPLQEAISGTTSYYEQDGLGSVSSLSNSAGAIANTYTYDSYGKITASSGAIANSFEYTGREYDPETSLYYYRARYYDQSVGRFMSEDPVGFAGGVDFYVYVKNRAVTLRDPTGTCPQSGDSVSNYHAYTCGSQSSGDDKCGCNCAYAADFEKCKKDCKNGCFPIPPLSPVDQCLCLCNTGYANGYYSNKITYWLCKHACKGLK